MKTRERLLSHNECTRAAFAFVALPRPFAPLSSGAHGQRLVGKVPPQVASRVAGVVRACTDACSVRGKRWAGCLVASSEVKVTFRHHLNARGSAFLFSHKRSEGKADATQLAFRAKVTYSDERHLSCQERVSHHERDAPASPRLASHTLKASFGLCFPDSFETVRSLYSITG